jgi:hypothetical protein
MGKGGGEFPGLRLRQRTVAGGRGACASTCVHRGRCCQCCSLSIDVTKHWGSDTLVVASATGHLFDVNVMCACVVQRCRFCITSERPSPVNSSTSCASGGRCVCRIVCNVMLSDVMRLLFLSQQQQQQQQQD